MKTLEELKEETKFKQFVKATIREMYAVSEFTKNQKVIKYYKDTADYILQCYEEYLTGEDTLEIDDIQEYLTMNFSDFEEWIGDILEVDADSEDYKEYVHCASMINYKVGLLF